MSTKYEWIKGERGGGMERKPLALASELQAYALL